MITGWFAEFGELDAAHPERVSYGPLSERFAGATYDPTSHYRAAEVFDFFAEMRLTPELLREVSQHQVGLLRSAIDGLDLPREVLDAAGYASGAARWLSRAEIAVERPRFSESSRGGTSSPT